MKGPFAYSNGWGHLIITIFFGILGALLILLPTADPTSRGIGVTLVTTASGAWFIPGAAKAFANEVTKATNTPPASSQPLSEDTVKMPAVKPPGS